MNDLLSIARRLRDYADEPGVSEQKQKDLLIAAERMIADHAMLCAEFKPKGNGHPFPGDWE